MGRVWLLLLTVGCVGTAGEGTPANVEPSDAATELARPDAASEPMPDAGLSDAGLHDAGAPPPLDAGVDAGPVVAPALTVRFPPPGCATSEAQLVVRGATSTGRAVQVNGQAASSSDGFLTWKLAVPLSLGVNILTVSDGQLATTVTVERFANDEAIHRGTGGWAGRILGLAWDDATERVVMADDVDDGAWTADARRGDRVEFSKSEGTLIGPGYAIVQPRSGVVSGRHDYVIDEPNIVSIDLATGERLVVATAPGDLNDLSLAPDGHTLVTASLTLQSVLSIDPVSGTSRVLSSSAVGTGPGPGNVGPLALSASRGTAYVGLRYQDTLLAIDLATGNRRVFSQAMAGEPTLSDPEFIAVDERSGRAFVWDSGRLIAVDLSTGRRKLHGVGALAWASAIKAMTSTPYGLVLVDYVPSWEAPPFRDPTLVVVDPELGTRVVLSR